MKVYELKTTNISKYSVHKCLFSVFSIGSVHGARYFSNGLFIDLEATVGTYELRSYGGEQ